MNDDHDQDHDDEIGDDDTSVVQPDGPVGTPPRPEPSRRRAMIEWAGGE
jgi:hypothetical protein